MAVHSEHSVNSMAGYGNGTVSTGKHLRLLFFGSSMGIGLTYHLTCAARHIGKMAGLQFLLVSGEAEQFPGLFRELAAGDVDRVQIPGIDEIGSYRQSHDAFVTLVRRFAPDVVHVQTNTHLLHAAHARFKTGMKFKIVYTVHAFRHDQNWLKKSVATVCIGAGLHLLTDHVIVSTRIVEKRFRKLLLLKTTRIPLGLDPPALDGSSSKGHNDRFDIVYLAKFRAGKGHRWLLRALIPVMQSRSRIHLHLPGDGKLLDSCRRMAQKAGLQDRIHLPGWVDRAEVGKLLRNASLAVVTSKYETFGHNILEPMFFGVPVISTRVGIAPEIVENDRTGYLLSWGDVNGLRNRIQELLADRRRLEQMGRNARDLALDRFTWKTIAKSYAEHLSELV